MVQVTVLTAAWLDTPDKVAWLNDAGISILNQDFEDWNWIIVDDASPLSPEVINDPRIRVLRASRRQGPAMCRNTAAGLAQSDAIVALDADDMLASPEVLGRMLDAWKRRPDRFYYGDLQLMENGIPGRVVQFAHYSFTQTLEPKGVVPVTAIHSKEAWYKGGGWKSAFEHGLEDVEYWISLGKAGFCGYKLDMTTLLYRKHPNSRTVSMRANGASKQKEMQDKIRAYHADVYEGRYPMSCCGGKSGGAVSTAPLPIQPARPRALPEDDLPGGKVWVQYNGQRAGEFFIKGQTTGTTYTVAGLSSKFEIHAQDAHFFRNLGRGKDFSVGIPSPAVEAPPVPIQTEQAWTAPEPQLAEVVRLEPEPPPQIEELTFAQQAVVVADDPELPDLSGLPLPDEMKLMLEREGWTVRQLAQSSPEELIPYPGIGKKKAGTIIEEAKRLWLSEH